MLRLWNVSAAADDYAPLASLPRLQVLALKGCLQLPACLSQLSALRLLVIHSSPLVTFDALLDEEQDELASITFALLSEALNSISHTQLTQLELSGRYPAEWPPALLTFERLQGLSLGNCAPESAPLAAGLWLHGLRWMVLQARLAAVSLPALSAATQLSSLVVEEQRPLNVARPQLLAVLHWAAQHPPLRHLEIDHLHSLLNKQSAAAQDDPCICAAVEQARGAAPVLCIRFGKFGSRLKDQLCLPRETPN